MKNDERDPSLISRAFNRLKYTLANSKVVRAITTLALASSVAIGAAACYGGPSSDPTNDPNTSGNTTGGNNGDTTDDKYVGYSPLLKSILTSDEINSHIQKALNDYSYFTSSHEFAGHPYSFLERQGHDIASVKKGTLDCQTKTYTIQSEPNNLYMITYVENVGSPNYYTEYLLKYTLTDQEMSDYKMMHGGSNTFSYYVQTVFLNGAIASSRNATIISRANMSVEAHKTLTESLRSSTSVRNAINYDNLSILLQGFDEDNQTFDVLLYPSNNQDYVAVSPKKLGACYLRRQLGYPLEIINSVFLGPTVTGQYRFYKDFTSSSTFNTTFYHIDDEWLEYHGAELAR